MLVSVIVPSYGQPRKLRLCLTHLQGQRLDSARLEVVVVDDAGPQDTLGVATELRDRTPGHRWRLIRHERNLGLATTRNDGAAAATGDLLVFLDSDIVLAPGALQAHLDCHARHPGDAAGTLVMSWIADVRRADFGDSLARLESGTGDPGGLVALEESMDPFFGLRAEVLRGIPDDTPVPWVLGACFCISMKPATFAAVGGFDPGFRGWGPEDIEFNYRAHRLGMVLRYLPSARCYHLDGQTKAVDRFVAEVSANLKHLGRRHPDPEIVNYLKFYKGAISYEDLVDRLPGVPDTTGDHRRPHRLGILRFLAGKTT